MRPCLRRVAPGQAQNKSCGVVRRSTFSSPFYGYQAKVARVGVLEMVGHAIQAVQGPAAVIEDQR